jgi:hypothetical protein
MRVTPADAVDPVALSDTCTEERGSGIVRGNAEGNWDATADAAMRLNRAAQACYGVPGGSSNTLQNRHPGPRRALRCSRIDATVQALAGATDPRLAKTLARS